MDEKTKQIWHAKRLISVAARAASLTSKRIRAGLPVTNSLPRTDRLIRLSTAAWNKAIA
jgi:hypothetical protein